MTGDHLLELSPWQPIRHIAHHTGVPEYTIRTWIRRKRVRTLRLHGHLLVNRADVDDMQARNICIIPPLG